MTGCDYLLPRAVYGAAERNAPCELPRDHPGPHRCGPLEWQYDDDCACCMFDEDTGSRCFSYAIRA